ncbi:MAG: hypothetical protein HYZ53_00810 [Planctomycetes bacterium]|nr:hypothetical protein [Planctomycetota bacterium]
MPQPPAAGASAPSPPDHAPAAHLARRAGPWLLVAVLAAAAYANAPANGFVHDDHVRVLENKTIRSLARLPELFRLRGLAPSVLQNERDPVVDYRPLTATTYALDWALWGARPAGFHATNVLLHVLASLALLAMARWLLADGRAACAAAALFAVHPVHTEAVTAIANRSDVLCGGLSFLAVGLFAAAGRPGCAFPGRLRVLSAFAFGLAFLAKEAAVVLPLLLLAWVVVEDRLLPQRRPAAAPPASGGATLFRLLPRALGLLPHAAVALLYLYVRHLVLGSLEMGPSLFDRGGVDTAGRMRTMALVLADYVRLAFLPYGLTAEYARNAIGRGYPHPTSWMDPMVLLSALVLVGCVAALPLLWRRSPAAAYALGWFGLALVPVSNLVFRIYVIEAERLLYLPTAGTCLLLGLAYTALAARAERTGTTVGRLFGPVLLAAWLAVYGWIAYERNPAWKDGRTLYEDMLSRQPDACRAMEWLAHVRGSEGDWAGALELAERLEACPGWEAYALRLRGYAAFVKGDYETAARELRRMLSIGFEWKACLFLGKALMRLGRNEEAGECFRRAQLAAQLEPDALRGLGAWQVSAGRVEEGLSTLTRAAELEVGDPSDASGLTALLARSCSEAGRPDLAAAILDRALADPPGGAACWRERGRLRALARDWPGAAHDLERAVALDGRDADALALLVDLRLAQGDRGEVERLLPRLRALGPLPTALERSLVAAGLR